MTVVRADAVVIGAGAGGLCAAARLAHAGLHTIVVDDKERIGGRASTEEIDGFTVNIGAIAIELGGVFEETFNTIGVPLDIRTPEPASSFFIDGKLIDVGRGGWSLLLGQLTKQASRILEKFRQPARRSAIDRGLAQDLHQQRLGARDLPQPVRGDLRLQRQ
jgi:phytoene dehydrogenase-like protein